METTLATTFTLGGLRCYIDENGTAHFNLRDVAIALGMFRNRIKNDKAYIIILWDRIRHKLRQINFTTILWQGRYGAVFIPEDVFYKLILQCHTEKAKQLHDFFTDQLLPELRKHSAYRPIDETKLQPQKSKPYNFKNKSIVRLVQETFKLANTIQKQRNLSDDEALLAAIEMKE